MARDGRTVENGSLSLYFCSNGQKIVLFVCSDNSRCHGRGILSDGKAEKL